MTNKALVLSFFSLLIHNFAWGQYDFEDFFKKKPPTVPIDYVKLAAKKIVVATKRLEFEEFPGAYNPAIIASEHGYILTFRYSPDPYYHHWLSYIGIVLLNENFDPISKPELLNTRPLNSKTPSQAEDARIFSYRGRLFLIYNDNVEITSPSIYQRRDIFVAELFYQNNRFSLAPGLKLIYEERYQSQKWQKNWIPFEHDGTLLMTYMLNPHEIIYPNLLNGLCYKFYESKATTRWKLGSMRGSTPPILVDGEYLAFFHSGFVTSSESSFGYELWHYFMGAYTFSAKPPFELTKMTNHPIIADGFYTQSNCYKRVIFPGGQVISGDTIYVAYGKDDSEMWIATIDKNALKKALVPINTIDPEQVEE